VKVDDDFEIEEDKEVDLDEEVKEEILGGEGKKKLENFSSFF
jgi:hypothetical protein